MKVLVLTTWENPKSVEGLKKYYENIEKYRLVGSIEVQDFAM